MYIGSTIVFFLAVSNAIGVKRLRILHTNDMHSRFEQTGQLGGKCNPKQGCYGGFARTLTAVNAEKKRAEAEGIPWVFLNAGDMFQGTPYYSVFKWPIVATFVDKLKFDAMSLGNHEFDDGVSSLASYLKNITTPMLTCNIDVSKVKDLIDAPLKPSMILERGGLRIGIIGYLTPETRTLSKSGAVIFKDEIESIRREVENLKSRNVNIIIALGHSGYDVDKEIAAKVKHLDIVVGGHSHTFLYTGQQPDNDAAKGPYPTNIIQSNGRIVPVVQAFYFTKYLGVFDVEFNDDFEVTKAWGNPIVLNSKIQEDPDILAVLEPYKTGLANISNEVIGYTKVFLQGNCRITECNFGNLINDALVDYVARNSVTKNWTLAAIAITCGGSVRNSINPGKIIYGEVVSATPFGNPVRVVELSGKYLLEALEWSVERYDVKKCIINRGEFIQASGLQVEFDLLQKPGQRVVKALARCAQCSVPTFLPIIPEDKYNIIINSFAAEGGDQYYWFKKYGTTLEAFDMTDTNIVIDYIKRKGIVYPGMEGRIQINRDSVCSSSNVISSSFTLLFIVISYFLFR